MLLLQNLVDFKLWKSKIFRFYEHTNFLGPCYFCLFEPTFHLVYLNLFLMGSGITLPDGEEPLWPQQPKIVLPF